MFSIVTDQSRGNTLSINGVYPGESLLPPQSLVALRLEPFVGNSQLPPRLPLVSALTNGNVPFEILVTASRLSASRLTENGNWENIVPVTVFMSFP